MPHFRVTRFDAGAELHVIRALCDGCDPARPCEEHTEGPALWIVTAGAFVMRDSDGKHVVDPTHALLMQPGHAFTISHPAGPDTCIAFRGPFVERIAAEVAGRSAHIPYAPGRLAALVAELSRSEALDPAQPDRRTRQAPAKPDPAQPDRRRRQAPAKPDPLALAEALVALASPSAEPVRTPSRSDRALAEAIVHELRVSYAEPVSLAELADRTGYSVFHACRVFRAVTGSTIHSYRRELRLRHALARIVDGDEPLAAVAVATGFASQSHLTNQYRARFGITPARTRTPDGLRRLAA